MKQFRLVMYFNRTFDKPPQKIHPRRKRFKPAKVQPANLKVTFKKVKHQQKEINPAKVKDMIESILPATARGRKVAFYFKRLERRRVRHIVNQHLRSCDSEGYTDKNLFLKPFQSLNVDMRRGYDKVNPFLRWAGRLTDDMSQEEALNYIRRLLPPNLIGDHAFSHWESEVKRKYSNRPHPLQEDEAFSLCLT